MPITNDRPLTPQLPTDRLDPLPQPVVRPTTPLATPAPPPNTGWVGGTAPIAGRTTQPASVGERMAVGGDASLTRLQKEHEAAIDKYGFGTYHGTHSEIGRARIADVMAGWNDWADSSRPSKWPDMSPEQKNYWLSNNVRPWADLSPQQQLQWTTQALPELAGKSLPEKQQWLQENLKNFSTMTPEDQAKWTSNDALKPYTQRTTSLDLIDQSLPKKFADLSPEVRSDWLRDNLKPYGQLTDDQKRQWAHQDLPELAGMTPDEKQAWLKENLQSFDAMAPPDKLKWLTNEKLKPYTPMKNADCINWTMENLKNAYKAAGMERSEINSIVRKNGTNGATLMKELQKDGWSAVYYAADVSKFKKPDGSFDRTTEHGRFANEALNKGTFNGVKLDGMITNYRSADPNVPPDLSGIEKLEKLPFFVGSARGFDHIVAGRNGNMNEFHWTASPDSKHSIEETPLKSWVWESGLVMVPPGMWKPAQ